MDEEDVPQELTEQRALGAVRMKLLAKIDEQLAVRGGNSQLVALLVDAYVKLAQ